MEGAKNFLGEILGAPNYHEVVQPQGTFVSDMLDSLKSVNMVQADKIVKAIKSVGWDASTEKALLAKLTDLTIRVSVPSGMNAVQDFKALPNYFTTKQWQLLNGEEVSNDEKHDTIQSHAASLTLHKASEPTCQPLTALALWATHGFDKAMRMSSQMLLNEYKFMKKRLKRSVGRLNTLQLT